MNEKIYILLPVHNRKEITRRFVTCLKQQTNQDFHLVLIDDGSTDGTSDMVRSEISNLTVLTGDGNLWWAGGLQLGVEWLRQQKIGGRNIVFISNDDIIFDADFLENSKRILEQCGETLLLPKYIHEATGRVMETGIEANLKKMTFKPADSAEKINCLPTRGLFMRMSDLLLIGNFHPRLLPHYLSDYEFTIRAKKKGLRLLTSADILIRRNDAASGYRAVEDMAVMKFLRQYFSKKYVQNPVYISSFILLTNPFPYSLFNLIKVWGRAVIVFLQIMKKSLRLKLN